MKKNIEKAITEALKPDNILRSARANGIYSEGESMDRFIKGMTSGVFSVASHLGVEHADICRIFNKEERNEKQTKK